MQPVSAVPVLQVAGWLNILRPSSRKIRHCECLADYDVVWLSFDHGTGIWPLFPVSSLMATTAVTVAFPLSRAVLPLSIGLVIS
jgi:hypothetical protein